MRLTRMVIALVVGALLAGCTGSGDPGGGSRQSSVPVTADAAASASAAGVTVALPVGAASGAGTLTVEPAEVGSLDDVPEGVAPVLAVNVSLKGIQLQQPATVSFPVPAGWAAGTSDPLVVMWQDGKGGWRLLPFERNGEVVTAQTEHFSWGFLGTVDVQQWAAKARTSLGNYLSGRSGVEQPSCGDEKAARPAGVSVKSDGGDAVKWCFGVQDGKTVLKIANNRRTFATVTFPAAWKVKDTGTPSISPDAAARVLGTAAAEFVQLGKGQNARTINGGDTLTLVVGKTGSGTATVEGDFIAWAFSAIVFGIDVYTGVAGSLGVKTSVADTWERFANTVTGGGDTGYLAAFLGCTRTLSETVGEADPDTGLVNAADKALLLLWGCLPKLMTADLKEVGNLMFGAGALLQVIGGVVGLVLSAVHLLVTGARELWDSFATFGGKSNVAYKIRIKRTPTSTSRANLPDGYQVFALTTPAEPNWPARTHGLTARQSGDTLAVQWLSQFHNPCFIGRWDGTAYRGTVADLVDYPAQALPYRDPTGELRLRVWADRDLYIGGMRDQLWTPSTVDQLRAAGAEMPDGPVAEYQALCSPEPPAASNPTAAGGQPVTYWEIPYPFPSNPADAWVPNSLAIDGPWQEFDAPVGATGSMYQLRDLTWTGWASEKATGQGRARYCEADGACQSWSTLTITLDQRRGLTCGDADGPTQYNYTRYRLTGMQNTTDGRAYQATQTC